ncbi:MAG: hypothetical protein SGI86_23040 [Deltaproteobacteria bacterium]|nr:hypothetical protein [Deltaproteobacteria bacterium]
MKPSVFAWLAPTSALMVLIACGEGDSFDPGTGGTANGRGGIGSGGHASGGTVGTGGGSGTKLCNGAVCDMFCEFGNKVDANGCELCACNSPTICPAIACLLDCRYGFVKNSNGCDSCTCNPPPVCGANACGPPTPGAVLFCPDGSIQREICAPSGKAEQCSWNREACPPTCDHYLDLATCETQTRCQWLAPGCSGTAFPSAKCFERINVNCAERASPIGCTNGGKCTNVTVDPCAGRPNVICLTCASPTSVCL